MTGTVVLATAAAVLAAGILYQEVTVTCWTPPADGGDCPPGQVVDETTSQPYLVPAVGTAVAVTLVAAVEAWVRARGRRADVAEAAAAAGVQAARGGDGPQLTGPSVSARGTRVDVSLLGLRFR